MKNLIVLIAALLIAPFSFAQVPPISPTMAAGYSGLDMINRIVNATPGINVVGITDGVTVAATGTVEVAAAGLRIPVIATATATIGKAAMAKAAARFVIGLGSGVGVALTAYDVYNWYIDSGYKPCPISTGAIFCKSGVAPTMTYSGYFDDGYLAPEGSSTRYPSVQAMCDVWKNNHGYPSYTIIPQALINQYTQRGICHYDDPNQGGVNEWYYTKNAATCPTNYTLSGGTCNYTGPLPAPVGAPYSPTELEYLTVGPSPNWDANRSKRMYDALIKDKQYDNHQKELWPQGTPVAWNSPAVTTPATVVEVATVPNPDGSTSTQTKKVSATVTPTPVGATLSPPGDPDGMPTKPGMTFPTTINTTITTVNNTTNATTINNSQSNVVPDPPADPCSQSPDSVACASLGAVPVTEPIPTQSVPVSVSSVNFASNASCPAPITYNMGRFGGAQAISWQPMCDWTAQIRAVFLACFAAAAAWIFVEGMKSL
jgi:hypothetical protein